MATHIRPTTPPSPSEAGDGCLTFGANAVN